MRPEQVRRALIPIVPAQLAREPAESAHEKRAFLENEELFRRIANTAPVMIWISGVDKLCTYFNQPWLEFTGRSLESELGNGWAEGVHPEDLAGCLQTYTNAFDLREPFHMEYRLRRHDGEYRWIFDSGVPIVDTKDVFGGYIGSAFDISERKSTQDALSKLSQRLIETQENERASIDEEVTDCLKSLASLSIYLDYLQQHPPQLVAEVHREFKDLRQEINEILANMRALSERLQSSSLDFVGLEAAAASYCEKLSNLENVKIVFYSEGIPVELPKKVSFSLYHILQEALESAINSGSRKFEVSLFGEANHIQLRIRDWSKIDNAWVTGRNALAIGMKDRVQLVGGDLLIESEHALGTTIRARVPL